MRTRIKASLPARFGLTLGFAAVEAVAGGWFGALVLLGDTAQTGLGERFNIRHATLPPSFGSNSSCEDLICSTR
ncbi:MAG: hypothetical protein P3W87_001150 [Gammaproteobacteria bacterium]|nr:hypothetical protein [Gammaproteobacteria bacterium]